ncbi:short-chain dehydrogenase/reductase family 9C member 7-like [Montipora foliosa]|uniref:short-chain dehydrogenase/reductase family 9C member 7-like n=1 Tax=Montipora foliosa TaxID=591990 RepID=UPI0035F1686C
MLDQLYLNLLSYKGFILLIVFFLTLYVASSFLFPDTHVPDLNQKAVLITGCDTGFGHELAKKLDALGLRVFASCLTAEGQTKLKNECSQQLTTWKLDVTDENDVKKAIEFVKSRLPSQGLWAVVNNAGIIKPGLVEWNTMESLKSVVEVNLWGTVSVTKAFLPLLKQTKGRIVNMASSLGIVSVGGVVSYCISKYGVQAFSDGLRREVKPFGVTVHIIEPGFFKTNINDRSKAVEELEKIWHNLDKETKESYGNEFYEQVKKRLKTNFMRLMSPHTYKVVDAMAHAAVCRRPKLRYSVGLDHKVIWKPLSFLPSELQDLLLEYC